MNEAELVFTEILNCNRTSLYLDRSLKWDRDKSHAVSRVIKRRMNGEPPQYILGKTEFMGLEFKVNASVFIPRPETEILVEHVITLTHNLETSVRKPWILDMCTGAGCIAVSLAKFLTPLKIDAFDVSRQALGVAQANARAHRVEVNFILSDLFNSCALKPHSYDIIVSNPPYIPSAEIDNLEAEVKCQPAIALDGGQDGLDFYRRIIAGAPRYLRKNGFLAMEIGFNQIEAIKDIFMGYPDFEIVELVKDYSQIDRIIVAKKII
jgi:release factor glutamine methyltransferase